MLGKKGSVGSIGSSMMRKSNLVNIGIFLAILVSLVALYFLVVTVKEKFFSGSSISLYWSDSCPHCVNMKPNWDNFVSRAKSELSGLTVQTFNANDADDSKKIPSSVHSFPTIMMNGSKGNVEYKGDRSADDLFKWAKSNM